MPTGFDVIRSVVSNPLPDQLPAFVTGIIGDRPSQYAKTPPLWNAVYRELAWDATSLPWDLEDDRLAPFLDAARGVSQIAGFSVTQPFKVRILPLLDELDPLARDIGAVNTVVRSSDGRLLGYNTDGQGAIDAITAALPGLHQPFLAGLRGRRVLLLGAGGAARAVAFYVASGLRDGQLRIVNRDAAKAQSLAESVCRAYGVGEGAGEDVLARWIPDADLVINATVKGQAGWRRRTDGAAFCLEPYSALAPADPAVIPAGQALDRAAAGEWFAVSRHDIAGNNSAAADLMACLSQDAACFDLIYAPLETRFLADARLSGHRTLNGKWMNIAQAADAFARKICPPELTRRRVGIEEAYRRAFEIMARVW